MKDRFWASCLVIIDYLFAALAWGVFFYFRKTQIEEQEFIPDAKFYLGLTLVPVFWFSIYYIQGTYHDIRRMFRLKMVNLTLVASILGIYIVFRALTSGFSVMGWPSLIAAIFFNTGVILIVLGILGVYIGRIYTEAKGRPLFAISEQINV